MVMIRSKRRIQGRAIGGCQEINIPNRNFQDRLLPDKHYTRSAGYVWRVIHGPDCLIGRMMPKYLLKFGGWCNGEIIACNIQTGEIYKIHDTIEAVI